MHSTPKDQNTMSTPKNNYWQPKVLQGVLDVDPVRRVLGEVVVHRALESLSSLLPDEGKDGGHGVASLQAVGAIVAQLAV